MSAGIAWSFRFPSATGLHQALGTSRRRKKRGDVSSASSTTINGPEIVNGVVVSASCRDLRGAQKRNTLSSQSSEVVTEASESTEPPTCAPSRSESTATLRYIIRDKELTLTFVKRGERLSGERKERKSGVREREKGREAVYAVVAGLGCTGKVKNYCFHGDCADVGTRFFCVALRVSW